MIHVSPRTSRRAVALTGVLVSLLAAGRAGWAQNGVTPLAPDATAYGMMLGEWPMAWWQWILSIPASSNPSTRTNFKSGKFNAVGQRPPVWFLPGVLTTSSNAVIEEDTTSLAVPAGTSILCGLVTAVEWNDSGGHSSAAELLADLAPYYQQISVLEATVDGVPIQGVERYRAQSPLFTAFFPAGNSFGAEVDAGTHVGRWPAAADGYWLLPPLPSART